MHQNPRNLPGILKPSGGQILIYQYGALTPLVRLHGQTRSLIRPALLAAMLLILIATSVANGAPAAQEAARIHDVIYGRKFGMALTMDVLKPAKPNGIGVIFVVSGGFNSDIAMVGTAFGFDLYKPFTDRGDTVFLVCHSVPPKFPVGEIVPDIHRAVRFIRVHAREYGVDPDRLGITGLSSGGFFAITLGTTGRPGDPAARDSVDRASSRVGAVGCFFPPSDLVNYGKVGNLFLEFSLVQFAWGAFGLQDKSKEEQTKVLRELSPFMAITTSTAPTLILHGDADPLVPYEQSVRFMARLEEMKVPHRLVTRPKAGHGWQGMGKDCAIVADWFDKCLAPKGGTP